MTQDIFDTASAWSADDRSERARRAVANFRAMQNGLSGFARALTGDKNVSVQLAEGAPRTDGRKIYFKPPIALGDNTPHERTVCDKRDSTTKLQLCPACRVREEVLISIFHEIAHIVFGTFDPPTEDEKIDAINSALARTSGSYARRVAESFKHLPEHQKNSYMALSNFVSPFMPILVNSLEDARVDEAMFKARRGTKVMFDAMVENIFSQGILMDDGSYSEWRNRPLNSQVLIGVFAIASGYAYKGWFHPVVEEALGDPKLNKLIDRLEEARSARATYELAFPILARLRELGFCKHPDDPEEEEEQNDGSEQQDTSEASEQDEGEPGDESGADRAGDSEQDGDDGSSTDESDSSDRGDSSQADPTSGDSPADPNEAEESPDSEDSSLGDTASGEGQGDSVDESGDSEEPDDGRDDRPDDAGLESDPRGAGSRGDEDDDSADRADTRSDTGDADEDAPDAAESDGQDSGELTDEEGSGSGSNRQEDEAESGGDREVPSSLGGDSDPEGDSLEESDGSESGDDEDVSPLDSGADEGKGGVEDETLYFGGAEGVAEDIQVFGGHEPSSMQTSPADEADDKAIDVAIVQGLYFEKPSANVMGVREHIFGQPYIYDGKNMSSAWSVHYSGLGSSSTAQRLGIDVDCEVGEDVLGPALLEMRRAFADNARADMQRHLKAGKVNSRVLGKRAWAGDERLFQKKRMPGKKSYAVVIGIDISGSTVGVNIALAKRAAMTQAELCARAGIDFAVYAHTARGNHSYYSNELYLDMYEIKAFDKPWNDTAKTALSKISSDSENLDGHGIEYYRKVVEKQQATDKIILYYSDGKMPAANYEEELEILQREIAYCKQKNITLLGVGIRTDSPRRHGLDTVQVDEDSDMVKVIRHLQGALLHNR